ncbi:MAG: AAC(3) family N-acetyltransferase [Lentisphaeria bacterium]|nr:AAC(3) family N-acetyltransferase [Lentisphaeria bacterium]
MSANNARIEAIRKEFSLFKLQDLTLTLAEFERTNSYNQFDASTRYVMDMLKQAGYRKVERLVHKADGQTSALDCIMPEAWDQYGRSFLKITSPGVPDYDRMLSDSDRHPQEAVIWSAPTPEGGVDGEIVAYDDLPDQEHPDVRGKWVFMESRGVDVSGVRYRALAEAGAAGLLLTNFTVMETSPDDVVWFNGQGHNSWYHEKEAPRLPVFSVPPRRAVKLLELLKKGKVTAHGEMKTRIYDGEIYTVTGIIPGESKEEYALFAHIYEPFEADDALGFATACELGRMLVNRKAKLKKTLRTVISMELYGFSAYLADVKRRSRIIAAMSLDGFNYLYPKLDLRLSTISLPYFTDWFYRDWFQKYLPSFEWNESKGNLSDDTFGGDPDIGVPTNWVRCPCGNYHHNTARYFQPDWLLVKEKFPVMAGALETLLTDGPSGNYNVRAVRDFKAAAKVILNNDELTGFEKTVRLQSEYDRYSAMLASWEKFTGAAADHIPLLRQYLMLKDKTGPVRYELFSTAENRARNIVPKRLLPGQPFGQSLVPYAERRKIAMPRLLWSLFDGYRDLLTCVRIRDGETGGRTSAAAIKNYIESLHFLEKYGYVRICPPPAVGPADIRKAFRKLGLRPGMKLIVHSAFSAIGQVEEGAEGFCRQLLQTIGPKGTVLMPAFTFNLYSGKDVGQPFDVLNSPSCCGILTEVFRKMPGVFRSCDPCHSYCAWGNHAADFIRNHHRVPTVSRFSPLGLLEAEDGWCLTIAAANAVTFMHVVESTFGAPCLGERTEEYPGILSDGSRVRLRTWGWRAKTCPDCAANQTGKLFGMLRRKGALKEVMLGNAQLCLFRLADYRKVYEQLLSKADCRNRKVRPRVRPATVKSDWDKRLEQLKKSSAFTGELPEFS